MTKQVEALIAGACLPGTNTRRVKRALTALFGGAVGKDVVSRTWRKVKVDWDARKTGTPGMDATWPGRTSFAWSRRERFAFRLDGTVVRVRLDRKATNIPLLAVPGVRRDGQKVLLAVKNMGGESEAAWRGILDGLIARGLSRKPEGFRRHAGVPDHRRGSRAGAGTGGAAARGAGRAAQRAQAQEPAGPCARRAARGGCVRLHGHIYAETAKQVEARRRAFRRKRRLRCPAVAASLEEAGDRLFTFLRLLPSQWKSARTTNAAGQLHEEFKRRIKTQTALPSAETAAMPFWALMASGPAASASRFREITMRKADGWRTLGGKLAAPVPVDLAA